MTIDREASTEVQELTVWATSFQHSQYLLKNLIAYLGSLNGVA